MNIKIISSTDRANSNALAVSNYVSLLYHQEGIEAEVISLEDFPIADVIGGRYGEEVESVQAFNKPIVEADGLVFVIPEYNGGFPGILKLFVDYLPFPKAFEQMPVTFIGESAGAFGGLRAVEQFQMITNYRNALQFSERVFIPRVNIEFDRKTGLKDDFKQALLESQVKKFIAFVSNNT